ncbi:minor capsid protein [Capybara microvirus Cap1_SP_95]|nr:minor capsid protein [Capybara microvirus Cap1_SP_95]
MFGTILSTMGNLISSTVNNSRNSALQEKQWEREDSAHQREVADLQAAGLSPLASLNGLTSSTTVAPQMAPQFDMNGVDDFFRQQREIDATASENQKNREAAHNDLVMSLEAKSADLQREIAATADEKERDRLLEIDKFNALQKLAYDDSRSAESTEWQNGVRQQVMALSNGNSSAFRVCDSFEQWKKEYPSWLEMYNNFLNGEGLKASSETSTGASLDAGAGPIASLGGSVNKSYSNAYSNKEFARFFAENPMPFPPNTSSYSSDSSKYQIRK